MDNKNFLNIHVIISHSPSCLNRDDMNMQKSAIFGGARRVRVSSQSLKRAMRRSSYYLIELGTPSVRSRSIELLRQHFIDELKKEFDPNVVIEAIDRFVKTAPSGQENGEQDVTGEVEAESYEETKSGSKKIAVAPWVKDEVRIICEIVQKMKIEGLSDSEVKAAEEKYSKYKGKKKKTLQDFQGEIYNKKINKAVEKKGEALRKAYASATDIALFGRMATSGLMTSVDGAMSVAHSITTHAVDADIDWFTAVDDLVPLGSGHLDTQEFSSGVFYRYASLNLSQLSDNMGGADRDRVLDLAAHLLHLLATVVPSAKQKSFAAYNPADLVMASFADLPLSAANAFEKPIEIERPGGYLQPSIKAFDDYVSRVYTGYGLNDPKAVFSLWDTKLTPKMPTLADMEKWVRNDGKDQSGG